MAPPSFPPSVEIPDYSGENGEHVPGLVVVFTGGAPSARVLTLASGPIDLGRSNPSTATLDDGRVSRRHVRIAFEAGRWLVTDLGSQNGTSVDGALIAAHTPTPAQRVIRVGDSLLVPCADVRPIECAGVRRVDGFVRGPAMQSVLEQAAHAARSGTTLHMVAESGAGKEGVAQAFHRAGTRGARAFVSVHCATLPHETAECLLFGTSRGAHTGSKVDAIGYLQEADGGTLLLDEIAELDLQVQAKLLRVLESKELLPLGGSKPRKVDFALCSASNKDLRAFVTAGTLREDLYFHIGRPAVTLPALRNRPEEIPALITHELATLLPVPMAHVSLVEQCLLRPWPGNVRELLAEIRTAAQAALLDSRGYRVAAHHLRSTAGSMSGSAAPAAQSTPPDDHDLSS
ncbi:MAG TPA: sigma 54-interacting transcriptional regulator [Kofleriaceae bacterium]|nr:sigma 54-interacting transcriptional regulator [Kofleriaceae bacterium]